MDFDTVVMFLEQGIATGVVTGAVYALLAIAIVSIFRTTAVANFAVGEIFMAGAYIALYLLAFAKVSAWFAIPVTIVAVFLGTAAFQVGVLRTVHKSGGSDQPGDRDPWPILFSRRGRSPDRVSGKRRVHSRRWFPPKPLMFGMAHLTLLDVANPGGRDPDHGRIFSRVRLHPTGQGDARRRHESARRAARRRQYRPHEHAHLGTFRRVVRGGGPADRAEAARDRRYGNRRHHGLRCGDHRRISAASRARSSVGSSSASRKISWACSSPPTRSR